MATNELIERLRSKRPIDLETLSDLLEEAADYVEGLEDRIAEKQKHIENLQKVNEDLEKRIAIMSEGGWHKTAEEKPELKTDFPFESITVICADKDSKHERTYPLKWCRRKVRGKIVYRWEFMYDNICYNEPYYWQYLPKPPKEGEAK